MTTTEPDTTGRMVAAAARRDRVHVHRDDGRTLTGHLVYWPSNTPPRTARRRSLKPCVRLDSDAYLTVPADQIRLAPTPGAAT